MITTKTTNIDLRFRPFVQIFLKLRFFNSPVFFLLVSPSLFLYMFLPLSVHLFSFSLEVVTGPPSTV